MLQTEKRLQRHIRLVQGRLIIATHGYVSLSQAVQFILALRGV